MTAQEHLDRIETALQLSYRSTKAWTEAMESLAALREQITELERLNRCANNSVSSIAAELLRKDRQIMDWESREASVCPEDIGIVEYVAALEKQIAALTAERDKFYGALVSANAAAQRRGLRIATLEAEAATERNK